MICPSLITGVISTGIPPVSVHVAISQNLSLTGIGITQSWFLAKSLWLPANVKFKANLLTKLDLGHSKVPFQRGMP